MPQAEADHSFAPDGAAGRARARALARGVARFLADYDIASLTEFRLRSGRRADLIGLGADGSVVIVEIKSSLADFRSDHKWRDYLEFCDRYFFAVPQDFPQAALPEDCGLMVADAYGAAILRDSPCYVLAGARRRALHLQFARAAGQRLRLLADPD